MRIGRIFKIVLVVVPVALVAGIAGIVVILAGTDFNQYKPLIAEETKKATGRDLAIAGDLKLEISLSPAVAVSGLTLSNAVWSERGDMVAIERLEAQVALLPLLFGDIEVKRIVLIGADIALEVDAKGRANFDFRAAGAAGAAPPEAAQSGDIAIPVVHQVVVRDSKLVYRDARAGETYEIGIDTLTLTGDGSGEPLDLLYEGDYNGAGVRLSGALGAPAALMDPDSPWPVDLVLQAGGAMVTAKGTIAQPAAAKGIDLAVAVSGDELADLAALAGAPVPKAGAYSLSVKITGDPASAIRLTGLEAALGGSDLAGDVTIDLSGAKPAIDASLSSNIVDLAALGGGIEGNAKQAKKKSAKIFPGDPLPLAGLRAVDATLRYKAGIISAAGAKLQDVTVGITLKGGKLTVAPIKAAVAGGSLDGTVNLDGRKDIAGLAAKIKLVNVDLSKLQDDLEGQASFDLDVTGRGASAAKIMAGLNGNVVLLMGKGRMKSLALQTLVGGPTQILGKLFTGGDSDYTVINCAVVRFPVKNGLATAEPLVLDTDVAAFTGKGTINLATEKPDLVLDPRVKKTTISAAVPIHIEGTLANPEYSPDKLAAARKVGGLLGLVLFPPAAILGLGELGAGDDNPCIQQAKSGRVNAQKNKKKDEGAGGLLNSAGESITKGLKGLFGD